MNNTPFEINPPESYEKTSKTCKVPWFYLHFGCGGGIGQLKSRDHKKILDPFKPDLSIGYSLSALIGFRNIYQLEYRPRSYYDADMYYYPEKDKEITIPMGLHIRNEIIHKFNPLFYLEGFKKPDAEGMVPCLFIYYGTTIDGEIKHVDKGNDGFLDGKEVIFGIEYVGLFQHGQWGVYSEIRRIEFEEFYIEDLGEWREKFTAWFWFLGLRFAYGIRL